MRSFETPLSCSSTLTSVPRYVLEFSICRQLLIIQQLFHVLGHPLAGREEQFPGPNNLQKMRRSIDNAETVGLLKPSRGPRGGRNNGRKALPLPPRRGFYYEAPARVNNFVGPRARDYLSYQTRPRAIQNLITPPQTPFIVGSVNTRTVVPLNTAQDAFTDFRTIRAARH